MFVYWLRYVVRLLIAARYVEENSRKVAATVRLNFPRVEDEMSRAPDSRILDDLYRDLQEDYAMLIGLLPSGRTRAELDCCLARTSFQISRVQYALCMKIFGKRSSRIKKWAISGMHEMVRHMSSAVGSSCLT